MKKILSWIIAGLLAPLVSGQIIKAQNQHTNGTFEVIAVSPALPPSSIELFPYQSVATAHPYALPKRGDAFYRARGEADVANSKFTGVVRLYARGVFVGYGKITDVQKPR